MKQRRASEIAELIRTPRRRAIGTACALLAAALGCGATFAQSQRPTPLPSSELGRDNLSGVLRFENQGSTQYTRAVPLNWDPTVFGGDPDHPIIWNQMVLGKDLTLNFNNIGSVAKYTTHLILPKATRGTFEAPAVYLRANFNRFWTYDAPSGTLAEITGQVPSGCNYAGSYAYSPHFGGAIVSDASGQNAMGVYGVDDANGGSVTFFNISNFVCVGDGVGESASDTVAISAFKGLNDNPFLFPAGESTYDVYLITDTLQNVAAQMGRLYAMGVH